MNTDKVNKTCGIDCGCIGKCSAENQYPKTDVKQELELKNILEMQKAFTCLYLEVHPDIVSDVKEKVFAVISQLEEKVKSKDNRINELSELLALSEQLIDLMTDTRHPYHIKYHEKLNTYKEKYGR